MVIAVTLGFPDELVGVVGQEISRTLGLHPLFIAIFENGLDELTADGVVFIEFQMILLTIQNANVNALVVGVPGDGGEVLLHGFTSLYYDILARCHRINMQCHLMAGHTRHRIFDGLGSGNTFRDVHQRIISHHALVHGVVSQLRAIGGPEDATVDGELVAVNTLAGHHAFGVIGNLDLLCAVSHIEVVVDGIGDTHGLFADLLILSTLWHGGQRLNGLLLDVETVEGDAILAQSVEVGFLVVEPSEVGDALEAVDARLIGVGVEFIEGQEGSFFLAARHHSDDVLAIDFHEDILIANPFQLGGTLGVEASVVIGSVSGCEELLFLGTDSECQGKDEEQE